ncbi:MAG: 30S ribosome-binding factor RbfA [Labilithrix sp.]|nr:30S ribosome-binding factor RbfA [Labilithrix sp.]
MKREPKKPARRPLAGVAGAGKNEASRSVRVAAQLRQEVARLVARDLADPRLEGLVIGSVWLSSDLQLAKVFFRIATTSEGAELDARRKDAEKALERASGRLRKAVTARLALRVAPELRFVYDEGQDARDRIEQLLDEVKRESKRGDDA